MAKSKKLNSMRWLEQRNIAYEIIEFDDSIHSAQGVADFASVPEAQVFKTLVVLSMDNKPLLVLLPGTCALDLKKLAAGTGHKKLQMSTHTQAEKMTGLQTGGISALALTAKNWPVFIEASATQFEDIYMSAGKRGVNVRLSSSAFIEAMPATLVTCCSPL